MFEVEGRSGWMYFFLTAPAISFGGIGMRTSDKEPLWRLRVSAWWGNPNPGNVPGASITYVGHLAFK